MKNVYWIACKHRKPLGYGLVDICSLTICFPPLATETFGFFHESFQLACSWDLYSWDKNSWPFDFRPFYRLAFHNCFWQPLLLNKKLSKTFAIETFAIWDICYLRQLLSFMIHTVTRSIRIMGKWYSSRSNCSGKSKIFPNFSVSLGSNDDVITMYISVQ